MNLIPNWRDSWKWLSVHFGTALVIVNALSAMGKLPPGVGDYLNIVNVVLGGGVVGGRVIDQGGK